MIKLFYLTKKSKYMLLVFKKLTKLGLFIKKHLKKTLFYPQIYLTKTFSGCCR